MIKSILYLMLAGSTVTLSETLTIDLPTALRLADEKNTDLAIQIQKIQQAELEKSSSWYQWVPTLRIGASYGWQNGPLQETGGNVIDVKRNARYAGLGAGAYGAGLPARPGLSADIDLSEAIYGPLAAKQRLLAANLAKESTRLKVMLDVASAYYDLVRAAREEELAALSAEQAAKLARQTADFASTGEGLQADAMRVEVESLMQQQRVEHSQERKEAAKIKLSRLLRLDNGVQLAPADNMITPLSLVDPATSAQEMVNQALKTRPEVEQNRAIMASEVARLNQEKYGIFLPKVEVGYSYGNFGGGMGTGNSYDNERNDLYGMVYWQFDSLGLRNRNQLKRQQALIEEAKALQEQAMVDIASQVRLAYAEFSSSKRQLGLSKKAVDSARKSYELNAERIYQKSGLPIEALQSVKAMAEAESLYLTIATKYNMAQLRLASATGQGLEDPGD